MLESFELPALLGAAFCYLVATGLFFAILFWFRSGKLSENQSSPTKFATVALAVGALFHLFSLAGQGPLLFRSNAGVSGLFGLILVVSYLVAGQKIGAGGGAIVTVLALCATSYSFVAPVHHPTAPERVNAIWLALHVGVLLLAYAALAFAFAASLLYMTQENLLKRRQLQGLWQKLPSLQVADEWIFRASALGLALLTLGLAISLSYNAVTHPDYVALRDPKVIFSGMTWAIFALYLGARLKLGWHGRRSNLFVIYGFVVMAFSFFGVPHLVSP